MNLSSRTHPTLPMSLAMRCAALLLMVCAGAAGAQTPATSTDVAAPPPTAISAPDTLSDGTTVSHWVLPNGLRVLVRDVPGSKAVAVTVAYGFGSDHDPENMEGLSALLGELALTAGAGEIPARARDQLDGIRPLGWDIKVTPRATLISEIGTVEQFPGILREVSIRMHGVSVTPEVLKRAVDQVRTTYVQRYSHQPDLVLHFGVRLAAGQGGFEALQKYAEVRSLDQVSTADVQRRLNAYLTSTNAVLSIAGDVGGFDVRRLIANTFADVATGEPTRAPPSVALRGTALMVVTPQLTEPAAVIGILAPALGDSSYPSFLLHTLAFASAFQKLWPPAAAPIRSRFQYQLLDEPDLVRLFPPVSTETTIDGLTEELSLTLKLLTPTSVRDEHFDTARATMSWLLGGPLPAAERRRMAVDPRLLNVVSVTGATRTVLASDAFWTDFRRRLDAVVPDLDTWRAYYLRPSNQVRVLAGPGETPR